MKINIFALLFCAFVVLLSCRNSQALGPQNLGATPQIVWKYGWNDGKRANTLGSPKNHDPLPLGTAYISTGYIPSDISNAYGFNLIPTNGNGSGQQIWIIDAYGSPYIASDLNIFCSRFNLPIPTLNIYHPYGFPTTNNSDWAGETMLDVEWAHAMAPGATINLVITPDAGSRLVSAVGYAATQGAKIVSMSWGASETSTSSNDFSVLQNFSPSPAYVASAGDHGNEVLWPAAASNVLSVGGTQLLYDRASNSVISETGWSWFFDGTQWWATGGGVSQYLAKPDYQKYFSGYTHRAVPDVSYDADAYTGVAVYFTDPATGFGGWQVVGGTSAGAPQWAALLACRASLGNTNAMPITQQMYYLASGQNSPNYANYFKDITIGDNGFPAKTGFDLMTGLGSPLANAIATNAPAPSPTPGPTPSPSPAPIPTQPPYPILRQWGAYPGSIPASATNAGVKAISLGAVNYSNSSALTKNGQVVVWGSGSIANVPSEASNGVSAISLGYSHMLAIKNGQILAWGDNTDGQTTIPPAAGGTNGSGNVTVVAISAGFLNSLALTSAGIVIGWGHGYDIFQGNHHYPGLSVAGIDAQVVNGTRKVVAIASGGDFTANGGIQGHTITGMVLYSDGTVGMFGDSMINAANNAYSDVPVGLRNVVAISLGAQFALALKSDGTVVAWGDNSKGQCNVPSGLGGVIAISAGGSHALALKSDGTVVGWGYNAYGQSTVPTGLGPVTAVEAGRYHSMSSTEGLGDSQTSGSGGGGGNGGGSGGGNRGPGTPRTPGGSSGGSSTGVRGVSSSGGSSGGARATGSSRGGGSTR
jgi:hypothetical protein